MGTTTGSLSQLATAAKASVRRLATIGENRLELLAVEMQEARERLACVVLLAVCVAAFGLLAGVTFTATLVVLLWAWSPWAVLVILTILYAAVAVFLYRRLTALLRSWEVLPASLEQIRKDRVCLEEMLD